METIIIIYFCLIFSTLLLMVGGLYKSENLQLQFVIIAFCLITFFVGLFADRGVIAFIWLLNAGLWSIGTYNKYDSKW